MFYELSRFVDLLTKNNPNILELLCTPADCVVYRNPLMSRLTTELFLSKLCRDTFASYAINQIKKARGLNKKIVNPMPREHKSLLYFCHVLVGSGSQPAPGWLEKRGWCQEDCGLVNVAHARDIYALFYGPNGADATARLSFSGIIQGDESNAVSVSSTPPGLEPVVHLYVNHDGYSSYCKDYREYWEWVEKRNDARYQNTLDHGKNYDAKT